MKKTVASVLSGVALLSLAMNLSAQDNRLPASTEATEEANRKSQEDLRKTQESLNKVGPKIRDIFNPGKSESKAGVQFTETMRGHIILNHERAEDKAYFTQAEGFPVSSEEFNEQKQVALEYHLEDKTNREVYIQAGEHGATLMYGNDKKVNCVSGKARDAGALEFTLTIRVEDSLAMMTDPRHKGNIHGTVCAPQLQQGYPELEVKNQTFELFTDTTSNGGKKLSKMRYSMEMERADGKVFYFYGFKFVTDDQGIAVSRVNSQNKAQVVGQNEVWKDTSTLHVTIFENNFGGPMVGRGLMIIHPEDFAKQLTTFRPINHTNIIDGMAGIARFVQFFTGVIIDTYAQPYNAGTKDFTTPLNPKDQVTYTGSRKILKDFVKAKNAPKDVNLAEVSEAAPIPFNVDYYLAEEQTVIKNKKDRENRNWLLRMSNLFRATMGTVIPLFTNVAVNTLAYPFRLIYEPASYFWDGEVNLSPILFFENWVVPIEEPGQQITLQLRRFNADPSQKREPILLIPGLGVNNGIFMQTTTQKNLVEALVEQGHDVFLLDFRANIDPSQLNQKIIPEKYSARKSDPYWLAKDPFMTGDHIAKIDIPKAMEKIREIRSDINSETGKGIHVVAHCYGSTVFNISVLSGALQNEPIKSAVLSQASLYASVPTPKFAQVVMLGPMLGFDNPLSLGPDYVLPYLTASPNFKDNGLRELGLDFFMSMPGSLIEYWEDSRIAPDERNDAKVVTARRVHRRISFIYGPLYDPSNLSDEMLVGGLGDIFGVAGMGHLLQIQEIILAGKLVDRFGRDVYLPEPSNDQGGISNLKSFMSFPVTMIHGQYNRTWLTDGSKRTIAELKKAAADNNAPSTINGREKFKYFEIPAHGHLDSIYGINAYAEGNAYPEVVKHFDAFNKVAK